MNPVLAKLGLSIGESLAKASLRPASRMVLGEPEQRAMDKIYQVAAVEAIGNIAATGNFSDGDLEHASSLLDRLIIGAELTDLPLLPEDSSNRNELLTRWQEIAVRQGLDPNTFPLPFEPLVNELLQVIPRKLAAAAAKPDSPLFRTVALAELASLRKTMVKMAQQMELEGQVELALDAARESCANADRRLMTPDVLLALLNLMDHSVEVCFATVTPGLPDRLRKSLSAYLTASADKFGPFVPFKWDEREDIRRAKFYAWANDAPVVTGPALLLGLLDDTSSQTIRQLNELLGEDIEIVRNSAWSRFNVPRQQGTPGVVFMRETSEQ
jgi:hypothetical protein